MSFNILSYETLDEEYFKDIRLQILQNMPEREFFMCILYNLKHLYLSDIQDIIDIISMRLENKPIYEDNTCLKELEKILLSGV